MYFVALFILLLGTLHVIDSFIYIKKRFSRAIYYTIGTISCIGIAFIGICLFYHAGVSDSEHIQYAAEYNQQADTKTTSYLVLNNDKIELKDKINHVDTDVTYEMVEKISDDAEIIFKLWSLKGFTVYAYIDGEKAIVTVNEEGHQVVDHTYFDPLWHVMELFRGDSE